MSRPLLKNLSVKLTACLIGGMAVIFSVLGYKIVSLHKANLEDEAYAAADRISDTIKRSTRFGMLNNHSGEVSEIIREIGSQPGIRGIRIYNKSGEIKFSTDESEINRRVDKASEACFICHRENKPLTSLNQSELAKLNRSVRTRIFEGQNGSRILGVINPIGNEPNCSSAACHVHSPETKILGVVDVTMSLDKEDALTAEGERQMVMSFIVAGLLVSVVFAALVWLVVQKPASQLLVGTKRVGAGDLDYKIEVSSGDELGVLADSFNRMTAKLKQANGEINDWARELETRVEEKTAELQHAHEQIVRVEKMASVGKLAAIVAHEINNPLAGILVYAKLLLKKISRRGGDDGDEKKYLETIAEESARCGEIVKSLLQFSRQTKNHPEPHDINELVRQSVRLVQHKLDLMSVKADLRLDETLGTVVCDAQQIKQALVALLINACEAMPHEGGLLTLSSRRAVGRKAVEIVVGDNGVGMDDETKQHIFEPFFTTKEQGKGVGLGLAVVYGIVQVHAGEIEVASAPGAGTTFTIRLPEAARASAGEVVRTEEARSASVKESEVVALSGSR